jgi:hypothetical protein
MGSLVGFIERAADLLAPVDGHHWRALLAGRWMATDGTGLKVLVPDSAWPPCGASSTRRAMLAFGWSRPRRQIAEGGSRRARFGRGHATRPELAADLAVRGPRDRSPRRVSATLRTQSAIGRAFGHQARSDRGPRAGGGRTVHDGRPIPLIRLLPPA